jgi:prepilin-type N-terminal cleavage/methylation domain-containing protein
MEALVNGKASPQRGFTVVEIAVALTVLAAGSSVLWYGLRASARMDALNRLHHAAVLAARSDLESLRGRPKEDVHDTVYGAAGSGADTLVVVRRVMDSARIVNTLEEIELDDKLSPKELRKPLEVRVRVYGIRAGEGGALDIASLRLEEGESAESDGGENGEGAEGRPRLLTSLVLKLPEYRWY